MAYPPCWYCGKTLVRNRNRKGQRQLPNAHTFDHVKPKCHGGILILVHSCYDCNQKKRAMSLEQYRLISVGAKGRFWGEIQAASTPHRLIKVAK